jgi:hypothetical protein
VVTLDRAVPSSVRRENVNHPKRSSLPSNT